MDFSTKYTVRTDLADEAFEDLKQKKGQPDDGIVFRQDTIRGIRTDTVTVTNDACARQIGKPEGTYITVTTGEVWKKTKEDFENTAKAIAECIKGMLPKDGLCLIVCLGNRRIISDAVGPLCANSIIVSRHIKSMNPSLFSALGLRECACIIPGVTGDTGAEASEIVSGAVEKLNPSCAIVIDALASRNVSRLVKTVQICDSGISPGSGVGNSRQEISRKTLGIPTVAIGVPTVVEAATLSLDLVSEAVGKDSELAEFLKQKLFDNIDRFFVCPKESDKITDCMAKLLGYSVNLALHDGITISEIDELLA